MKRWIILLMGIWCASSVFGQFLYNGDFQEDGIAEPLIDIQVFVKDPNETAKTVWLDADYVQGPYIIPGQWVYLKFVVTNIGNVPLDGVVVRYTRQIDDMGGPLYGYLAPGEVWEMEHKEQVLNEGQYKDFGYVVGYFDGEAVYDSDRAFYFGAFPPGPAPQLNQPMMTAAGEVLPLRFDLSQNHPNPFNPATTIPYDLPYECRVTVRIYDILGSEVVTLIDGDMPAGRHSVVWNGADNSGNRVSSGVYFYTLQTPDFQQTRRLMLLR